MLPCAYYVAGAHSQGGFGEEGAFVFAARQFDVTYPPGAPISALLSAPFALLPLGPLAFRVAVANALFAALALALFARALLSTLPHVGVSDARLRAALALSASLLLAQAPLFWQQAVRAQVFSVQFALSMLVFDALLRFEAEEPHGSTRTLYFGAFVQGLCFANHHVYGLLLLPVAAPTLGRVFAYRGFMGLMGHVAAPLVGFSAYVYVPSRLASGAHGGWAEPSGFSRLASMLGAEPYWGPAWAEPEPVLGSLRSGLLGAGMPALLLALPLLALGLWATLRSSNCRRFGLVWLIALLVPLGSVSWVLQPKLRADVWGALLPCAAALIAIASCGAGLLLTWLGALRPRLGALAQGALLAACALGLVLRSRPEPAALQAFDDAFDELSLRALPARAVLFQHEAASTFRYLGREAEEELRGDLTLVPLALRGFPRLVEAWAAERPELADSLSELSRAGRLKPASLQALSALRPVYVELAEQLPEAFYVTSLDEGLLGRVLPDAASTANTPAVKAAQAARLRRLYGAAGTASALPMAAAQQLAHTHLLQALQRAALGDRASARGYLALARALGSHDPRIARLEGALSAPAPLDIEPYLSQDN